MSEVAGFYEANREAVMSGLWQYGGFVRISRPLPDPIPFIAPEKHPPRLGPMPFTFRLDGFMNTQTGHIDGVLYGDGEILECFGRTGYIAELGS